MGENGDYVEFDDSKFKDEHELESEFFKWHIKEYPYDISSHTPYGSMGIKTRLKIKERGYQGGFPDRTHPDPRIKIEWVDDFLILEVFAGQFFEFKNPKLKKIHRS